MIVERYRDFFIPSWFFFFLWFLFSTFRFPYIFLINSKTFATYGWFVLDHPVCFIIFRFVKITTFCPRFADWAQYCCCCSSPDSLKLGFRCTQSLVVRILWPISILVSFAHSWVYSMLHYELARNSRGSYSIITSPWPRVLAGVPY